VPFIFLSSLLLKLTLLGETVTIPPMRKGYVWILAIVALLGMANCMFVEPAFACNQDTDACSVPASHGCLVCNSASHQLAILQSFPPLDIHGSSGPVIVPSAKITLDPPPGSIFLPPTIF